MLMVLCLAVVIGFRDTDVIGNAYGLAAITVMFLTTCLMFLIICAVWKRNIFMAFLFVMSFGSLELLYFSASLPKVHRGGWLPLLISLALLTLMLSWHYGTSEKLAFELQNKISIACLVSLGPSPGVSRVPGIGLYVMVPKVSASEKFLVCRIAPPEFCLFQCIVRYGYKDLRDSNEFEILLIEKLMHFLKHESNGEVQSPIHITDALATRNKASGGETGGRKKVVFQVLGSHDKEEMELMEAKEAGVAYMTGNTHVLASETSSLAKKFAINVLYGLLRRNCCRPAITLGIPHTSLIEVGMVYHV
ncbi:hypothetical protein Pint_17743 [Pistacia integerrima]|uniref:Uncharacterized protein n=1 Tax=Pistacia integerrima TaxID=434235 RepID=A0ACC0YX86_9ROSI|nr:hypothetical protein Pint_17743 [Pistacia integerrima]